MLELPWTRWYTKEAGREMPETTEVAAQLDIARGGRLRVLVVGAGVAGVTARPRPGWRIERVDSDHPKR
jgi:hypothetical protein